MKKILLALALIAATVTGAAAQSVTSSGSGPNIQFRGTRITSTQSLVSGTITKVQLNSIGIDTGSYWDGVNFYYKPLVAGTYQVCGSVYASGTGISAMEVAISKNGTSGSGGTEVADQAVNSISAGQWAVTVPCSLVSMNGSSDTVELDVSVTATSPVVNAVRSTTQMTAKWVSP